MPPSEPPAERHQILALLENRPQHRVNCDVPARLAMDGNEVDARLVNIGLNGLRLDLGLELIPGQLVDVKIPLPGEDGICGGGEVVLPCQVVWTLFGRTEAPYPTGLKFRGQDPKRRRALVRFLTSISKEG